MMLLVCYYPKMWFYLQLKIVFTLSSFGLVKSLSCFCVVFKVHMVGLSGLEPLTSRLSGVRSNQLSYRPILKC